MSDEPRVAPALSAEEWAEWRKGDSDIGWAIAGVRVRNIAQLIAVANDSLEDDDPRKITRERIALLRMVVSMWDGLGPDPIAYERWRNDPTGSAQPMDDYQGDRFDPSAFLDALAFYLPPAPETP